MKENNFLKMSSKEQANTYGGFAFLALFTAVTSFIQVIVSSSIAIYQAVEKKSGSVSFGGSKTITQKNEPTTKKVAVKGHAAPPSFSAY